MRIVSRLARCFESKRHGHTESSVGGNYSTSACVDNRMRLLILSSLLFALAIVPAFAADLTGTWIGSVDLANGQHGDPVFTLKQADGKLTGTYTGPFGE